MKKHTSKFFAVVLMVVLGTASILPAFASTETKNTVQPRWTNLISMDIKINKTDGYYDVEVEGKEGTTKIELTATLYEQGTAGYVKKDGFTTTRNSRVLIASDTYSFNSSKLYKVVATAKVTANGVTETVTLEKVK